MIKRRPKHSPNYRRVHSIVRGRMLHRFLDPLILYQTRCLPFPVGNPEDIDLRHLLTLAASSRPNRSAASVALGANLGVDGVATTSSVRSFMLFVPIPRNRLSRCFLKPRHHVLTYSTYGLLSRPMINATFGWKETRGIKNGERRRGAESIYLMVRRSRRSGEIQEEQRGGGVVWCRDVEMAPKRWGIRPSASFIRFSQADCVQQQRTNRHWLLERHAEPPTFSSAANVDDNMENKNERYTYKKKLASPGNRHY